MFAVSQGAQGGGPGRGGLALLAISALLALGCAGLFAAGPPRGPAAAAARRVQAGLGPLEPALGDASPHLRHPAFAARAWAAQGLPLPLDLFRQVGPAPSARWSGPPAQRGAGP